MFLCPQCHEPLEARRKPEGVFYHCESCAGRAVGIGVLRKSVPHTAVSSLWRRADEAPEGARMCPACRLAMRVLTAPVEAGELELDVCRRCYLVWFDAGERDQLESAPAPQPAAKPLSEKARVAIALQQLPLIREREERSETFDSETPDEWWKWIPAFFGWPVEKESSLLTRWPLVAWGTALLLALLAWGLWGVYDDTARRFGLIASEPLRNGGLSFLVYFFLPGSLVHGLANAYFLAAFGDNIEEELGPGRLALILLLCSLGAAAAHALAHPTSVEPLVGAQGALSGVAMFYSLRFPRARLGFMIGARYSAKWLTIPVWLAFLLWGVLQLLGLGAGWEGWTRVSTASLLGGVIAGYWLWFAWRDS